MRLQVEVAGRTDIGYVRANNEDNFGYDTQSGVFVVCDGMGGNAAGEVASKVAVDAVLEFFRQQHNGRTMHVAESGSDGLLANAAVVGNAIYYANDAVQKAEREDPSRLGMGSTIAIVHVPKSANLLAIGHVGDTRVYRIRDGKIELLTSDHSLVMEQVRRGLLTAEQAQRSAVQNVLLQALGSQKVQPDLAEVPIREGDRILVATDGVTKQVPDSVILECLTKDRTLDECSNALIDAARRAGGEDNATCLVLSFRRRSWWHATFRGGER